MKKTLLTILQYVIFLGLGIWIVYHMLHELNNKQTSQLVDAIKSIDVWYLLPICLAGFFSHFFRAWRWRYLLETVDARPSIVNTTFAVLIGYIANLALPRAGEVAKCTVLAKYEKTPAHKMIGTIVAERAFDVLCLVIVTSAAFLLQKQTSAYLADMMHLLSDKIERHQSILIIVLVVFILLIIAAIFIYRRHRETKVGKIMKEMLHGILSIFRMKKRWQFIGYTVLIWTMYLMQIYLGLKSLPATHHLTVLTALVILVYGSVGMIVTPGGIGLYTLLVAQILTFYQIDEVPAEAFGWIAWAVQTGIIIVLGITSLLLIHPYNRRKHAQTGMDTKKDI